MNTSPNARSNGGTPPPPSRFATDFGSMMLEVYGELCGQREQASPDEQIVVYRRAESTINGVSALIVLGNGASIDRFMQEHDLND